MAGSIVQSRTASSTVASGSIALAFNSNNAAGNVLWVVGEAQGASPGMTAADSVGNSYSAALDAPSAGTVPKTVAHWAVASSLAGANIVTVSNTITAARQAIYIAEISGVQNLAPDKHSGQAQLVPGTATDAVSSGSVTTATDFAIALSYEFINTGVVPAIGTGFTADLTHIWFSGQTTTEFKASVAAGTVAATFTAAGATDSFLTVAAWFQEIVSLTQEAGTGAIGTLVSSDSIGLVQL